MGAPRELLEVAHSELLGEFLSNFEGDSWESFNGSFQRELLGSS